MLKDWVWDRRFLLAVSAVLVALTVHALEPPCGFPEHRDYWGEGGPGAPNLEDGRNFYTENMERYPGYGFVLHSVNVADWDEHSERKAILDAVKRLRAEFRDSYHRKAITRFVTPAKVGEHFVPFDISKVVISIRNNAELDDRNDRDIPVEELHEPVKVGYLYRAEILFGEGDEKEIAAVFESRVPKPHHYDFSFERPKDQRVYDIVDNHEVKEKQKQKAADDSIP